MPVNHYHSTDAGAPELTGQLGSLPALLDAILDAGYGSGGTAKAGAGWTVAYSGDNKRAYQPPGGAQRFLRVDHSSAAPSAEAPIVRGYDEMSDIDTGTAPFPGSGTDIYWRASNAENSTAMAWDAYVSDTFLLLFVKWRANLYGHDLFFFGDVVDVGGANVARTVISGHSNAGFLNPINFELNDPSDTAQRVFAIPDATMGLSPISCHLTSHFLAGQYIGDSHYSISEETGGVAIRGSRGLVHDNNAFVLGEIPGLVIPWLRMGSRTQGDIFDDLIGGDGRSFRVQETARDTDSYWCLVDITGPWS
ncbi:hypothetical protein [Algiphilus sp.]|uniref:hypothetical protein n=1 Tax=Algiphilus sp. TaxID=1872431 RepID=UPI0025B8073B|nr:hypothetical protein [Algiphilus sp.]MCK5770943.1 hypothetical protein [Algiphilus sp.]